jgi:two-component system chemotaxis response regulator CheY
VEMTANKDLPILIVDDFDTMLQVLRNLLRQLGFRNVDEASDAPAALEKLRNKPYQLVISDWNMKPMTGLELLKAMRGDQELNKVPFIMATAEATRDNVTEAKAAGVNNYIVKPFSAAVLRVKISAVLGEV